MIGPDSPQSAFRRAAEAWSFEQTQDALPMKTKHTPGPWRIEDKRSRGRTLISGDGWMRLCDVYTVMEGCREPCPEGVANARLIAAAPDLLAALQKYVEHFGDPLRCARPAIAKAVGMTAND